MISKELLGKKLLSLVLGETVITGEYSATTHNCGESFNSICTAIIETVGNELSYTVLNNGYHEKYLNLDTLGRLCKEWCWDNDIELKMSRNANGFKAVLEHRFNMDFENKLENYNENVCCMVKTELEAIIKATEFVAKEKGLI